MKIEERIAARRKIRAGIDVQKMQRKNVSFLLISESLDDYIEHRIEADKVLEGTLKDIQGSIASMAEMNRSIFTENTN